MSDGTKATCVGLAIFAFIVIVVLFQTELDRSDKANIAAWAATNNSLLFCPLMLKFCPQGMDRWVQTYAEYLRLWGF